MVITGFSTRRLKQNDQRAVEVEQADYLRTRVPKWITSIALFLFFLSFKITFGVCALSRCITGRLVVWSGKTHWLQCDALKMNYHELIGCQRIIIKYIEDD